jgi:integrase
MTKIRHTKKRRRAKGAGSIIKDKKSGIFYYFWHDANGKQHKKSLRTKNREEAETAADGYTDVVKAKDKEEVLMQSAKARKIIHEKDLPLADVWSAFKKTKPTASKGTLSNYKRMLNEFINWLASERPSITSFTQIDLELAIAYTENVWQSGISASTYNYKRSALATITKALQNRYGIDNNYWLRTERKKAVQQKRLPLDRDQVKQLLKLVDDPANGLPYPSETACLIKLCLFAGMRLFDAVNIKWDNIDQQSNYISYESRKTQQTSGAIATIPIFPILRDNLNKLDNSNDYVLPKVQEHYSRNAGYIKKSLLAAIHKVTGDQRNETEAQKVCARSLYGTHSLRHTFATEAAKCGVKSIHLSRMLGDSIKTIDQFYVDANLTKKPVTGFEILSDPQKQLVDPDRVSLQNLIDAMNSKQIKKLLTIAKEVKNG